MDFRIFFGHRLFTVSDSRATCFKSLNGMGTEVTVPDDAGALFDFFEQSSILEFYVYTETPECVFDCLKRSNRYIRAAGGAVFNTDDALLLIRRLGYWDLPKGKIEEDETEISAARREIEEECGVSGFEITERIMDTYHVYRDRDNRRVIKQTTWFKSIYSGRQSLKPQLEEDITEAVWTPLKDISRYVPEMYASLKDVLINLRIYEEVKIQSFITTLVDIQSTAQQLSKSLSAGDVVALYGSMGVGKTTLIKAICHEMRIDESVTSPTFSLVNEYKTSDNKSVYHFDFYRIRNIAEVYDMGYEEYFYSGDLCFVEWPEMIEDLLPENTVRIYIKFLDDDTREVTIR
jgi:tRNA threonylcarbamoyladenosine biosynthesis protein TsaE